MSTFRDIENIFGLMTAIDSGEINKIWASLARKIDATTAKDIGEAKEVLGDDFDRYVPPSREALRMQREQNRIDHEKALQAEELRKKKAEADIAEDAARRFKNIPQDQLDKALRAFVQPQPAP